jgi:hypothetical protein|tara:strand:- start:329 stop:523 length:195 start_codon:yes stop_codon:yes gene_type:complete
MSKIKKLIKINDVLYECLGTMSVESSSDKGPEYWKEKWNANSVLRTGNEYYYCRIVIDAEFEDI